jgi:sRNA-binding protein
MYCGRVAYLDACKSGVPRIDLAGNPNGTVSEEHAKDAAAALAGIMARRQARADTAKAERREARWAEERHTALETGCQKRLEKEAKAKTKPGPASVTVSHRCRPPAATDERPLMTQN